MLGVWSFTYALVHLSMYLVFDQSCYSSATCEFHAIWEDILKRQFIFIGMFAFSILLALAITSTNGWVRRLKKNWQRCTGSSTSRRSPASSTSSGSRNPISASRSGAAFWLLVLFAVRVVLDAFRSAAQATFRSP